MRNVFLTILPITLTVFAALADDFALISSLLRRLKRAGLQTASFGYTTTLEDFDTIKLRLISRIARLASVDKSYILIGHSLGGVLIRAALNEDQKLANRPKNGFC